MTSAILEQANALEAQVIAWRRHLHQHPELSFQEHQTAQYVKQQLADLPDVEVSQPTPTSVLAVLKGGAGPGKTVLVRADMDALPIQEETGLEFASQREGVMHACGHDGHTAMLLGAARILSQRQAELHGEVRLIFQHAEELFPGGAQQLVDVGVMDGVDYAVGTHLMSHVPTGQVMLKDGPLLAAPDGFDITIQGKGGHAATPNTTVDPVVIAAHLVLALQSIVSRQKDPREPLVLSITTIHAGTAHNVIPDTLTLTGTVRSFDAQLRQAMPGLMETIIKGVTQTFGATYTFNYQNGYRALLNDPEITEVLRGVVSDVMGPQVLVPGQSSMGAEDFSAYLSKAPGTFVIIGAGNVAAGITAPHHHPKFTVDESALKTGVAIMVGAAEKLTQYGVS